MPATFRIFSITNARSSGYDVPLHQKLGTEFLVLLVALMAYLSLLAACGFVALGHISKAWTSGLENSITIEIPADNGSLAHIDELVSALEKIEGVQDAKRVSQKEMKDLLSPWLGDVSGLWEDLPIPVLLTVTLKERNTEITDKIASTTRKIAPDATVDAHEEWLNDLLRLANGLQIISLAVFCLIMLVTATVVAGAVRSRMAIHHRELELLHIMGASDFYISGQFTRYIFMQAAKGMVGGLSLGIATVGLLAFLSKNNPGTIPSPDLAGAEWGLFVAVPLLLALIAVGAAYITSLRVLREMP